MQETATDGEEGRRRRARADLTRPIMKSSPPDKPRADFESNLALGTPQAGKIEGMGRGAYHPSMKEGPLLCCCCWASLEAEARGGAAAAFLFSFPQAEKEKEKHSGIGEEFEKYENISMILELCPI